MMFKIKNTWFSKGIIILCIGSVLCACAKKPKEVVSRVVDTRSAVEKLRANLINELSAENSVQVIELGETIRIILNDDYLFNGNSAEINDDYKPVLRKIARLMRTYDKINVKVAAYLNKKDLNTQQAQAVSTWLWDHNVDARLMYAVGYGNNSDFNKNVTISFSYKPQVDKYK